MAQAPEIMIKEKDLKDGNLPIESYNGPYNIDLEIEVDRIAGQYSEHKDLIRNAYHYANYYHQTQIRDTGDMYIAHPVSVAKILAEYKVDYELITAAILHDVYEDHDGHVTLNDLEEKFGRGVRMLCEGATKMSVYTEELRYKAFLREEQQRRKLEEAGVSDSSDSKQSFIPWRETEEGLRLRKKAKIQDNFATLRKIYLTMKENPRVILLKLADRLHNTRTIEGFKEEKKRRRRSQETLDYYAPLATRLGIWTIKAELEDTSLKYVDPEGYEQTKLELERERALRHDNISRTVEELEKKIREAGLEAEIVVKPKHLYSVYRKKQRTGRDISQIYDIDAININVPTVADCYAVLGVVHSVFIPQPDKMSDYIANPKNNNYRAFHTTIKGCGNQFVEVQITDTAQARINEWGVLAKYYYRDSAQQITNDPSELIRELQSWITAISECNELAADDQDFIDIMCSDGMATTISVFTPPNGEVKDLKEDSVAMDAAYKVHTNMGDTAVRALVNKEPSSLDRKLRSGDFVEIVTKKEDELTPEEIEEKFTQRRALYFKCATRSAKNGIVKWLAKQDRSLNIDVGKVEFCRTLISMNIASLQHDEKFVKRVAARCGLTDADSMFFSLGCLSLKPSKLREVLEQEQVKAPVSQKSPSKKNKHARRMQQAGTVVLASKIEAKVFYGGCCAPLPGDQIKGYLTSTNDVVRVHTADCPELKKHLKANPDRYVEVKWGNNAGNSVFKAPAGFRMRGRLRKRLTSDVIDVFDNENAPILHFEFDNVNEDSETQFRIIFLAPSADYVAEKQKILESISDITSVVRLEKI